MKWVNIDTNYKDQIASMRAQSAYERLGVDESVSLRDAKKAFKAKMKLYHPDRTHSFMSFPRTEIAKLLNDALEKIKEDKKNDG